MAAGSGVDVSVLSIPSPAGVGEELNWMHGRRWSRPVVPVERRVSQEGYAAAGMEMSM